MDRFLSPVLPLTVAVVVEMTVAGESSGRRANNGRFFVAQQ